MSDLPPPFKRPRLTLAPASLPKPAFSPTTAAPATPSRTSAHIQVTIKPFSPGSGFKNSFVAPQKKAPLRTPVTPFVTVTSRTEAGRSSPARYAAAVPATELPSTAKARQLSAHEALSAPFLYPTTRSPLFAQAERKLRRLAEPPPSFSATASHNPATTQTQIPRKEVSLPPTFSQIPSSDDDVPVDELVRGAEMSPEKAGRRGGKFVRGGLAERTAALMNKSDTFFSLWSKDIEKTILKSKASGSSLEACLPKPEMRVRITTILDLTQLATYTKCHPISEAESLMVVFRTAGAGSVVSRLNGMEVDKQVWIWKPWEVVPGLGIVCERFVVL